VKREECLVENTYLCIKETPTVRSRHFLTSRPKHHTFGCWTDAALVIEWPGRDVENYDPDHDPFVDCGRVEPTESWGQLGVMYGGL
jgi:hypothetical protein